MLQIKVFWEWVKTNWKLVCLSLWTVLVWFLSRRSSQAALDAMKANKISYESRIKSLKEQHALEIEKREKLNLKYEETIVKIEEKYKKKEQELTKKEKKQVKEIIKEANDDPDQVSKKIEELFGFISDS